MTTLEATRLLGFHTASGGVIDALRKAGVEETRNNGAGSGRNGRCLWRRDQVESLAKEREHVAWLKAQGFRFCNGCGEWKDRASHFAPSGYRCRECMRKVNKAKAAWATSKRQRSRSTFCNTNPERLSGSVESYVGHLRPAEPTDALKYACMDVGFHHRPIPRGTTKRKAFCAKCGAERCMWYSRVAPKAVVKMGRFPHQVRDYPDAG